MVLATILAFSEFSAYRTWKCVTPQAVDMTLAIAMSCIGPASWDTSPKNPHVKKRFKVWVNPIGRATLTKPVVYRAGGGVGGTFPAGTVIVKEKYDAAQSWDDATSPKPSVRPLPSRPELLTIMAKGPKGSKPSTGDWSYYVADANIQRVDASQEKRCASCHAAKKSLDFTFRSYGLPTH